MDGRGFLKVAEELLRSPGGAEAHWRAAAGRAYYALVHEGRAFLKRRGIAQPPTETLHKFVKITLLYSDDPDLRQIGQSLDRLSGLRNDADYELGSSGRFAFVTETRSAVATVRDAIDILDRK